MQSEYERVALHILSRLSDDERATVAKAAKMSEEDNSPMILKTLFEIVLHKYASEIQHGLKLRDRIVRRELAQECAAIWRRENP